MKKCIIMDSRDNVATVLERSSPGDALDIVDMDMKKTREVCAVEDIPFGHKICLKKVSAGEFVIKYGEIIGKASSDIAEGSYVHIHNVISIEGAENING